MFTTISDPDEVRAPDLVNRNSAANEQNRQATVGLVTHADEGSQFTSVRFTERLEEINARPSIGAVAD